MAHMVVILGVVVTLLGVVLQHHPSAAYTCYNCSPKSSSGCSCCTEMSSVPTCQKGGCSTVYYPDGNVTRMCDENVSHGCKAVGVNTVCGCHEDYCNKDACPAQFWPTCQTNSTAASVFPIAYRGLAIAFASSIIGIIIR